MVKNMNELEKMNLEKTSGLQIVKKIKYLGIYITMKNINLFKDNYIRTWKEIRNQLEIW